MGEEELEDWQAERIAAIQLRLRIEYASNPASFWNEIDETVTYIVMGTADLNDTDWPEDLHLADVVEKRLNRAKE